MNDAPREYPVQRSDAEWQETLGDAEFQILRRAATERPGTGELLDEERDGLYRCGACHNELFVSGTKFDAGCGWPSFYESIRPGAVELLEDTTLGTIRTEVRCANCGSHLGHVFPDGFGTPTGDRYCMNSLALTFEPGGTGSSRIEPGGTASSSADPGSTNSSSTNSSSTDRNTLGA